MSSTKPKQEFVTAPAEAIENQSARRDPRVKLFGSIESLETLRAKWLTWSGNRDSDWYLNLEILKSNLNRESPYVLCVYRDGVPDAILVGRKSRGSMRLRIGYLKLDLTVTQLYFVYGAFRGNRSRENAQLLVREIFEGLRRGEADVAYLNFLREESPLFVSVNQIPPVRSRDLFHEVQKHYAGSLPGTMDEFYKRLSPNSRSQVKGKLKKLSKQFPNQWRIRCFRAVEELDELIRDAEPVASKSYQRGLGVGFKDTPEERDRLRLKAQRGWLRAYILYLAEEPAAIWFGDINEGIFGSDYLAFNPKFGKYSPGICLTAKVIESFCGNPTENVSGVDFATGYARYKEMFSDSVLEEKNSYIFAPTFRGTTLNLCRWATGEFNQVVKGFLQRIRMLEVIKKRWRSRLSSEGAEPQADATA
jgi:hypothetical protein